MDYELHGGLAQSIRRMLVRLKENGGRIFSVQIVQYRLFAHKLQAVNAEQIRGFKQLHNISKRDLALISIEVGQDLVEHLILDLLKLDLAAELRGSLVQRNITLEHRCEIGAPLQE